MTKRELYAIIDKIPTKDLANAKKVTLDVVKDTDECSVVLKGEQLFIGSETDCQEFINGDMSGYGQQGAKIKHSATKVNICNVEQFSTEELLQQTAE